MRPVLLYLRSRQVPAALAAAVGSVAVLWVLGLASDRMNAEGRLGLLAVVTGVAAAGAGLAGADVDLDRAAAIAWPPRRAAHIVVAGAVVLGIVTAAALTGDRLAPAAQIARDVAGMSGLVALGAATLGAGRAWVAPLTWTLFAWALQAVRWPPPAVATYQVTWMVQPAESTSAAVTAVTLGTAGTVAYAILGPRP